MVSQLRESGIIEGGEVQPFGGTAQFRLVTLSTAQILALFATEISVIPAPGAAKMNVVERMVAMIEFNTAAYAGIAAAEDLVLRYTDDVGDIIGTVETTGFLDAPADAWGVMSHGVDVAPLVNAAIVAHMTTAEVITGDSPVHLAIWYRTLPAQWV